MSFAMVALSMVVAGTSSGPVMPTLPNSEEQAEILARAKQRGEEIKASLQQQGKIPDGGVPKPQAPEPWRGPQPPPGLKAELMEPFDTALQFFEAIVNHNGTDILELVKAPFYFEGKLSSSNDDARRRWTQAFAGAANTSMTLYGIEVLSWDDMVKKYGKPPQRLSEVPSKGAVVAVANVNGQPMVAMLHKDTGGVWQVYAFHD